MDAWYDAAAAFFLPRAQAEREAKLAAKLARDTEDTGTHMRFADLPPLPRYDLTLLGWAWDYYGMTRHLILNPRMIDVQSVEDVDMEWWNDLHIFKKYEAYFRNELLQGD